MSEEHKPKHTGPTNQAQIPSPGCGDCDRWRLPATSQSQKTKKKKLKGRVVVYVAMGHNW